MLYKRPFDLTVLVVSHLLMFPMWVALWIVIPLLIWLGDRGPVFYRQQRFGKDGQIFEVLKFRTMIPDSDQLGTAWTNQEDPRVTRVGRILRRTALDELPEIISIWKGDMSFVGPRPLAVEEQLNIEKTIPSFRSRLQIRPGLTGLAQVYDRIDNPRTKLSYDLEYIRTMSLWGDLKLMVISVWNTIRARWDTRGGKN